MYGYSFGAAEVGLRHKINDNLMIYPGYVPREGVEPLLMHYGLPFNVGNSSFDKLKHHEDGIVYDCSRLFPEPPYPREEKYQANCYYGSNFWNSSTSDASASTEHSNAQSTPINNMDLVRILIYI